MVGFSLDGFGQIDQPSTSVPKMSEPHRITFQSMAEIPFGKDLLRHVDLNHHVVVQVPVSLESAKPDLINRLREQIPEFYSVFDSGGTSELTWITIKELVSRPRLETIESELIEGARVFRRTAFDLAHRWADYNGVPAPELWDHLSVLKPFPGEWDMEHHGGHQCFINDSTGQIVEVSLWFGGEFGTLDPQFFHTFLRTSPDLRCPPELQDAFHDSARALEFLEERGLLKRIDGLFDNVGVFAPESEGEPIATTMD